MSELDWQTARILIVDDQRVNITLLEGILENAGYQNIESVTDPREAQSKFEAFKPDLVLLDLQMPHVSGFEVMTEISASLLPGEYLPILVLTADVTSETRRAALAAGAMDFLSKPFDAIEVVLRAGNLLTTRFLHLRLEHHAQLLAEKLCASNKDLQAAQMETMRRLAQASKYRDDATERHAMRVGDLSALLGQSFGMDAYQVELLRMAAPLHDIGKIGISDKILLKPTELTTEELEDVKKHVSIGADLLKGIDHPSVQIAESIARYHHERWDGTGYFGLKGEEIPLAARIVSIVDTFDVITHDRPYRKARRVEDALMEIRSQSGKQFDPELVELLAASVPRLKGLRPVTERSGEYEAEHRPKSWKAPVVSIH
jgi:putative two-component system response regulator